MAQSANLPAIGVILGPVVAAELIRDTQDLAPLLDMLASSDPEAVTAGQTLLRHTVGARLSVVQGWGKNIAPEDRFRWAQIAAKLIESPTVDTAMATANLLHEVCFERERLTEEEATAAGGAARAVLGWLLAREGYYRSLVREAIEAVARTYSSDPSASAALIRRLLQPERIDSYGFLEMPELADEVQHLVSQDPGLVRDIYAAVLSHAEDSDDTTVMREGVLSLTSRRSQDYNMAKYSLCEAFDGFLSAAPAEALDALGAAVLASALRESNAGSEPALLSVDWLGEPVEVQRDGTYWSWDSGLSTRYDEDLLLDKLEAAVRSASPAEAHTWIDRIRSAPRPAGMWRRVLRVATERPDLHAREISPLAMSVEVLRSTELSSAVGTFLDAAFADLPKTTRIAIEQAVLSIVSADDGSEDSGLAGEAQQRDRLLRQLDPAAIVGPEASALADEARKVLSGWESADPGPTWAGYPGQTEHQTGTDSDDADAAKIRDLSNALAAFADAHLNSPPPASDVDAIEAPMRELWEYLRPADRDPASGSDSEVAWLAIARAAEVMTRPSDLPPSSSALELARAVLIAAASRPGQQPPSDLSAFDESPHWTNDCRASAARGLLQLARVPELMNETVSDSIRALAADPHPAVRMEVAARLNALRDTASDLRAEIATQILQTDTSSAVVHELLAFSLHALTEPPGDLASAAKALRTAFDRFPPDTPGAGRLHEVVVSNLGGMYIGQGLAEARQCIDEAVLSDTEAHPDYAEHVLRQLREASTVGGQDDEPSSQTRQRAIGLATEMFAAATAALKEVTGQLEGQKLDADDPRIATARTIAHIIDGTASEFYFATGAFDEKQGNPVKTTLEQRKRLFIEAGELLDQLCEVAFPSTTQRVVESLESFISFDPRGVFLLIAKAVAAGKAGNYQADPLALDLVVRLVERYLAEYPALLQQDDECRAALIQVLDIFVEAGWPQAMRLTYRLHDIYR